MSDEPVTPVEQPVEPDPPAPNMVAIPIHNEPQHVMVDTTVTIRVAATGGDLPQLLLWDGNLKAYVACYLPRPSVWMLQPGAPGPVLWVPGMPGGPQ